MFDDDDFPPRRRQRPTPHPPPIGGSWTATHAAFVRARKQRAESWLPDGRRRSLPALLAELGGVLE